MTYDSSRPPEDGDLQSAEIRANWSALAKGPWLNFVADPTFLMWSGGVSNVDTLDHWKLIGPGNTAKPASSRLDLESGAGNFKHGPYSCKILGSSAGSAQLAQTLLSSTDFRTYYRGLEVSVGFWVKAGTIGVARPFVYDGVTTHYPQSSGVDVYNTTTAFEWISFTATLDSAATMIQCGVEVASNATPHTVYADMAYFGVTPIKPEQWTMSPHARGTLPFNYQGSITGATTTINGVRFYPRRPFVLLNASGELSALTSGTFAIDINKSGTSVFGGTKLQITAAATVTEKVPDGATWDTRCFGRAHRLTIDIDSVGVGAQDLTGMLEVLQFMRPFEFILSPSALGV